MKPNKPTIFTLLLLCFILSSSTEGTWNPAAPFAELANPDSTVQYRTVTRTVELKNQLGKEGRKIFVELRGGGRLLGGNQLYPFGVSDWVVGGVTQSTEHHLHGGVLDHTAIAGGNNIALGLYGNQHLRAFVDVKELYARDSLCWGIQTDAFESHIEIDHLYVEGLVAYSSWSDIGKNIKSNRTLRVGYLEVVNNRNPSAGTDAGAVRLQRGGSFLPGTTEHIEIDNVLIKGGKPHATFTHQQNQGGDGGVFSIKFGSIRNETPASSIYAAYEKDSNNSLPAELQFGGGSVTPNTNTLISLYAQSIHTTQGILTAQGTYYGNNCRTYYRVDNGVSTGQAAIFMPHPNIPGTNSEIIVSGNYRTLADAPAGIVAITNGKVTFIDCDFQSHAATREIFEFSDDTVDEAVHFIRCTFKTTGTGATFGSNAATAIDVVCTDCYTNSNTANVNVNVIGDLTYRAEL